MRLLTLCIVVLLCFNLQAQKPPKEVIQFDIERDFDNVWLDGKPYLPKMLPMSIHLKNVAGDCMFHLYNRDSNTSSCGKIKGILYKYDKKLIAYKFDWYYANDYDNHKGIAQVMYTQEDNVTVVVIKFDKHELIMRKVEENWKPLPQNNNEKNTRFN